MPNSIYFSMINFYVQSPIDTRTNHSLLLIPTTKTLLSLAQCLPSSRSPGILVRVSKASNIKSEMGFIPCQHIKGFVLENNRIGMLPSIRPIAHLSYRLPMFQPELCTPLIRNRFYCTNTSAYRAIEFNPAVQRLRTSNDITKTICLQAVGRSIKQSIIIYLLNWLLCRKGGNQLIH